ncbi:hypothetical protein J5N97_000824 [Dioscorea zingiberensis]|uniref:Uncharacterized protein n=1 Tax=Dioscorea zingiberensis TaxID=325984 RepID=A0A9D5H2T8_9LILI|nr:hypothetical protein J5N97_000824 [Dioscorea zingiberensis]
MKVVVALCMCKEMRVFHAAHQWRRIKLRELQLCLGGRPRTCTASPSSELQPQYFVPTTTPASSCTFSSSVSGQLLFSPPRLVQEECNRFLQGKGKRKSGTSVGPS